MPSVRVPRLVGVICSSSCIRLMQHLMQELAFTHKYPHRDPEAWKEKLVKYRPDLSGEGYDIALGPLVSLLMPACT